jgi:homoserine O-acetyltransferase
MRTWLFVALFAGIAASLPAAPYPTPVEHDVVIHDYHFATGETLAEVRIHYATLGTPQRDDAGHVRNAVLVMHGTGGSLQQFLNDHFAGVLFAPGGLLDAARYFIILPDDIGHGHSSKPSDGLHARFPHYDYDDMVDLEHWLVADGLGVDHLFLVMGTSMGGMHTWLWGERYPTMMDGLLPLASQPAQIAGRNRVWRRMILDDIRSDPEWKGGEYSEQPRSLVSAVQLLLIAGSAPLLWQNSAPTRDAADQWLTQQMATRLKGLDANDFLYAIDSSRNYDPSPRLGDIQAPLLAINSADDFINPPELRIMETLIPRVKRGRFVLLPVSEKTRGHGTHTWPELWQSHLAEFLKSLR